jgi:hypothetical protein
MTAHSIVSLLCEVLAWVGLPLGAALYIAGLSVRGFGWRWVHADAVIAASPATKPAVQPAAGSLPAPAGTPVHLVRWFDRHGDVHDMAADTEETHSLAPGDDVSVWFNSRHPDRCRTHSPELDGKGLRVIGLVLLGTGFVATVLGFVLMFF